jgi:exopolysaccharide production protein ExoZ
MTQIELPKLDDRSTLPVPASRPADESTSHKLLDLQILRALAASLVVADHVVGTVSGVGVPADMFHQPGHLMGHLGVITFFVLSGLIMVRQSSGLFGGPGGALRFAYRRIVRIVPMYWIATLAWAAVPLGPSHRITAKQLLLSLCFIPNFLSPLERLEPVLGQGWTLNYEMAFYFLFFLALFMVKRNGLVFLFFVPQLLVAMGHAHLFGYTSAFGRVANFYCDPIILSFAFGVVLGMVEFSDLTPPRWSVPISPAWLLLLPGVFFVALPSTIGQTIAWELLGLYGAFVVVACTLVKSRPLGFVERTAVLLGDASYGTYLFHLFCYLPIAVLIMKFWGHNPANRPFIVGAMIFSVVFANLLGLAIHLYIERPITRAIRKLDLPFSDSRRRSEPATY